jgi:hypothetical protein
MLGFAAESPVVADDVYRQENLVAWCIVPFDAKKRGPAARAEMLSRLGIKRVAYDWRDEHVATFEEEIQQYQKHGLEYFAFWSWHPDMAPLIKKYGIRPQIWRTNPSPAEGTQQSRVMAAAKELLPLVQQAKDLGCKFGIYNHGGWGGEPENLIAVCQYLRTYHNADHVGIIYNFHHGHEHTGRFESAWKAMMPYVWCLNVNGMNDDAQPKIVTLGEGQHEQRLMGIVRDSGYSGPVGILDHRNELDAEVSLRDNLAGIRRLAGN